MRKSTLGQSSEARAPIATRHCDDVTDDDPDIAACRREKEAAEAELATAEARRQRALAGQRAVEETEERAVFRAVMFWQHFTMYVLYFVCLMNIFITAFGIYSSSNNNNNDGGTPGIAVGGILP